MKSGYENPYTKIPAQTAITMLPTNHSTPPLAKACAQRIDGGENGSRGTTIFPTAIPAAITNGSSGAHETLAPRKARGQFSRKTGVIAVRKATWNP